MTDRNNKKKIGVHCFPNRLFLVSLPKTKLDEVAHTIMKLLLFPLSGPDWLFNYTSTYEEISMIVTLEGLKWFPSNSVSVASKPWRALSILSSEHMMISEVSRLLSKAGISIYYLSTYECDFILVPENDFVCAMNSLTERFQIISNESFDLPVVDITTIPQNITEVKSAEFFKRKSRILECTVLPEQISICSWSKEGRKTSTHSLLHILFFSKCNFLSFTETEEEITLMIDQMKIDGLSQLVISDPWIPIQRFKKNIIK